MDLKRVDIIGGGPAGLYTALLLRKAMPRSIISVHEQNAKNATFGFGVVFSNKALDFLRTDDSETYKLITPHMEHWQSMTLVHQGETVVLDGIGFAAIGRLHLLQLLQQRAEQAGVNLIYGKPVISIEDLSTDLVIGADGFNSLVRSNDAVAFNATLSTFSNHFAWFGATRAFDTLTQTFIKTDQGAMNAHHYRYTADKSTFIVECDDATFKANEFISLNDAETIRYCENVFADTLQGASLVANKSVWRQFPKLWCERWYSGNRVLLGDAAHTAHFSIGSGTRLALEDAIALCRALSDGKKLEQSLDAYETARKPIAKKIVNAANTSASWYDGFAQKLSLSPIDFAFDYVTRSGRVDLQRLRQLSPAFMRTYDAHIGGTGK